MVIYPGKKAQTALISSFTGSCNINGGAYQVLALRAQTEHKNLALRSRVLKG